MIGHAQPVCSLIERAKRVQLTGDFRTGTRALHARLSRFTDCRLLSTFCHSRRGGTGRMENAESHTELEAAVRIGNA